MNKQVEAILTGLKPELSRLKAEGITTIHVWFCGNKSASYKDAKRESCFVNQNMGCRCIEEVYWSTEVEDSNIIEGLLGEVFDYVRFSRQCCQYWLIKSINGKLQFNLLEESLVISTEIEMSDECLLSLKY